MKLSSQPVVTKGDENSHTQPLPPEVTATEFQ